MTNLPDTYSRFSTRTSKIIGRDEEIELIRKSLEASGNQVIYFWAMGGYGKTRLLEEAQKLVKEAGPGYYFSGIIDLYLSDMHSNSDIERTIVENLDPNNKYFKSYREKRRAYELLRERGTDPRTLEDRRKELRQIFISEERDLAAQAYKVVLCFDTVELLQYESSAVEKLAGSIDTRIKTWILEILPQLNNILVIFSGRPKTSTAPEGVTEEETQDHHKTMIDDFKAAFKNKFIDKELNPLTQTQVQEFLLDLTQQPDFIPAYQLPVVHKLTGGNPVLLHLWVDLIRVIAPEPRKIYEMLDRFSHLATAAANDPELKKARAEFEKEILDNVFNSGELSGHLSQIASLPKGVNHDIFKKVLGLTDEEANQLFEDLKRLSFVKMPRRLPGPVEVHEEQIFFHEEIYRTLSPKVIRNLRSIEQTLAQSVINNYYNPLIQVLQEKMDDGAVSEEERVAFRERMQKLVVERLHYLLIKSPKDGYLEYKHWTEYANRFRQVGFSMRLMDEFLRDYNWIPRREFYKNSGITHEQIIRESAQMWIERLHWWGEYRREIELAEKVFINLSAFHIAPDTESGIYANIKALWGRAKTMETGYDSELVSELEKILTTLPALEDCDPNQLLGRGRLLTSIGYAFRQGGLLEQAVPVNDEAIACFRKLGTHLEELAIVLNNQARVVARQGYTAQGRSLAFEALRISRENLTLYSDAQSRNILSAIERMALEDFSEAEKWALEAKEISETKTQDDQGVLIAYLNLGGAWRKLAERDADRGRDLVSAINKLNEAVQILIKAISLAQAANFPAEIPGLNAELGKVHRSLGRLYTQKGDLKLGIPYFREAEKRIKESLTWTKWNIAEKADVMEDLAEVYFLTGDQAEALRKLDEIWELLGDACRLEPGDKPTSTGIPNRYYLPLGKVERLQGEMAMENREYLDGLKHFATAYAYFERYSKTAVEKNKMTETIYSKFLNRLPSGEQRQVMRALRAWMHSYQSKIGGISVQEFLDGLGRLVGA
jgi:tetratricopeptide (TPR) repeat protein